MVAIETCASAVSVWEETLNPYHSCCNSAQRSGLNSDPEFLHRNDSIPFWVHSKGSMASRWPLFDVKCLEAWMFACLNDDRHCSYRHRRSLELITAQFFLFGSMSRATFSHNPHVQHLINTQLAQGAQESRGLGKVYALKLGSEKIIKQHLLHGTINWTQTGASVMEQLYRHFFVFFRCFVGTWNFSTSPKTELIGGKNTSYLETRSLLEQILAGVGLRVWVSILWWEYTLSCSLQTDGANFISVEEIALCNEFCCPLRVNQVCSTLEKPTWCVLIAAEEEQGTRANAESHIRGSTFLPKV